MHQHRFLSLIPLLRPISKYTVYLHFLLFFTHSDAIPTCKCRLILLFLRLIFKYTVYLHLILFFTHSDAVFTCRCRCIKLFPSLFHKYTVYSCPLPTPIFLPHYILLPFLFILFIHPFIHPSPVPAACRSLHESRNILIYPPPRIYPNEYK